mmetsp:Transcript_41641/g.72469  ORF Transcript_41641/g.72469 Transcript_41641/m.72469 type:complete len:128 (+) Transcript_41641:653-1036(+)
MNSTKFLAAQVVHRLGQGFVSMSASPSTNSSDDGGERRKGQTKEEKRTTSAKHNNVIETRGKDHHDECDGDDNGCFKDGGADGTVSDELGCEYDDLYYSGLPALYKDSKSISSWDVFFSSLVVAAQQ